MLVIFIDLSEGHFGSYKDSAGGVNKMIVAFLVAHLELGHIGAGSVEPFLKAGDLGKGQVGLVIPDMG